jgi:hypothetical protein
MTRTRMSLAALVLVGLGYIASLDDINTDNTAAN